MMPIPAGALVTVTSGAYSDYNITGTFRSTQIIDVEAEMKAHHENTPPPPKVYGNYRYFAGGNLLADWVRRGLLEPIDTYEIHWPDHYEGRGNCITSYEAKDWKEWG